ncbi:MAG: hypothetical protein ACXV4Z_07270 [Halobacteriota archaeon]
MTKANLTISSHNATNEEKNATGSTTSNATSQTDILNETTGAAGQFDARDRHNLGALLRQ